MNSQQKQIVAVELKNAGFNAEVTKNGVVVSLKRSINTHEVKYVLTNVFEEIEFCYSRIGSEVLVK